MKISFFLKASLITTLLANPLLASDTIDTIDSFGSQLTGIFLNGKSGGKAKKYFALPASCEKYISLASLKPSRYKLVINAHDLQQPSNYSPRGISQVINNNWPKGLYSAYSNSGSIEITKEYSTFSETITIPTRWSESSFRTLRAQLLRYGFVLESHLNTVCRLEVLPKE